ncbi:glycosyltransferase family 2 protein [Gemmatimonas sp.]|jgi:glycosyltransferase involved in cell wall biosynthesis|uniref:glycosyltransferase family 2 protein n=1 Tax=Gemmatimonas sp. TaxID=1962908 RepID=UPI0022BDFCBA|nr:glycosyltransferase family 2 protein [Gemmatimonas sp.]MCZ8204286.1 glycosyltransferase family 2 protein [Gemmatimonas sp.]
MTHLPGMNPLATCVVLCRNEASYIERCVMSLVNNRLHYPQLEILVVDGLSDDGTREIVQRLADTVPDLRLVDNVRRTTPAAFNTGILAARGSIILPIGAHATYPPHYCATLIAALQEHGADNVGGHCRTIPANGSGTARGIALALGHPLGVGNALFRLRPTTPRWADTVPFGCYRRELFDRIGLFDEELLRNQDDEFNHRLRRAGGRILLVPDVEVDYVARGSFGQLRRMFWQYGVYKPLAAAKVGSLPTVRQLVPPAFVLSLLGLAVLALLPRWPAWPLMTLVVVYALAIGSQALRLVARNGAGAAAGFALAVPVMHVMYGAGWLYGALRLLLRGGVHQPRVDLGLSR